MPSRGYPLFQHLPVNKILYSQLYQGHISGKPKPRYGFIIDSEFRAELERILGGKTVGTHGGRLVYVSSGYHFSN